MRAANPDVLGDELVELNTRVLAERVVVPDIHLDRRQQRIDVWNGRSREITKQRLAGHRPPFDEDDVVPNAGRSEAPVIEIDRTEEPFVEVAAEVVVATGVDGSRGYGARRSVHSAAVRHRCQPRRRSSVRIAGMGSHLKGIAFSYRYCT